MGERDVAGYYTLSDKDFQAIRHHRRDHNRLGFSIQLCHLRFPGWPLKAGEIPASELLAYVARQLNVSPELFHDYARGRDTTRREHLLELQRDFGFQTFTDLLSSKLADQLLPKRPALAETDAPNDGAARSNARGADHRAGIFDRGESGVGDSHPCGSHDLRSAYGWS